MMTDSLSWDSFICSTFITFRWKFLQSIKNKWHLIVHWMHHLDQKQRNLIKSKPFQKTWDRVTASEVGRTQPPPVILDRAPESTSGSVFLIDSHLDFLPFFVWVCLYLWISLTACLFVHTPTHTSFSHLSGQKKKKPSRLWIYRVVTVLIIIVPVGDF